VYENEKNYDLLLSIEKDVKDKLDLIRESG